MEPYVLLEEELVMFNKEQLIEHIRWLYKYLEYVKEELRHAKIKV